MNDNMLLVEFELVKYIRHTAESANSSRDGGREDLADAMDARIRAGIYSPMIKATEMCVSLTCDESRVITDFLLELVNMMRLDDGRYNTELLLRFQECLAAELAKVGAYPSMW